MSNQTLAEALEPFANCCDQIGADEPDDEWAKFRLTVGDYRRARSALSTLRASTDAAAVAGDRDDAFEEGVVSLYRFDTDPDRARAKEAVSIARLRLSHPEPAEPVGLREASIQLGDEICRALCERGHASCGQEAVRIAALTRTDEAQS